MPSPQTALIEREFPDLFTTAQVAVAVGRDKRTVMRWRKRGLLRPSHYTKTGQTTVWLYTEDDLKKALLLAQKMKG
jgi:DNA-binding transcriptional MerR regulator